MENDTADIAQLHTRRLEQELFWKNRHAILEKHAERLVKAQGNRARGKNCNKFMSFNGCGHCAACLAEVKVLATSFDDARRFPPTPTSQSFTRASRVSRGKRKKMGARIDN